jgi:cytochrome c oxidase assembly factor 5
MLADCLQESDCVMVQRRSAADCLQSPLLETLPMQCQQLKHGLGECRRGWLDMRKRFRGNMPASMSKELEGMGVPRKQLYGGTPTRDVVQRTDGNDDSKSEK